MFYLKIKKMSIIINSAVKINGKIDYKHIKQSVFLNIRGVSKLQIAYLIDNMFQSFEKSTLLQCQRATLFP